MISRPGVSRRTLLVFVIVLTTAGGLWAAKPAPPPPPPPAGPNFRFQLTLLGTLGGSWSQAMGINQLGDVVGYSAIASGRQHGFVHFAGDSQMTDVNSLVEPSLIDPTWQNGWEITSVGAINDSGEMVASGRLFENGVKVRGSLLWLAPDLDTGELKILEIIPNYNFALDIYTPVDINADGDFVILSGNYDSHVWTAEGGLVNLGRLNGRLSYVQGMSNRDSQARIQIVGITFDGNPGRAWRTTYTVGSGAAATLQDLGHLYQDRTTPGEAHAVGINSSGTVIFGETTVAKGDIFAAVHANGAWTSLGTLNPNAKNGSWNNSWSSAGNDLGYVIGGSMVGTSSSTPNTRTFIYHSTFKMWNLDSLIDASVPIEMGLDLRGINNTNEIAGTLGNGVNQAFVLVPYTP